MTISVIKIVSLFGMFACVFYFLHIIFGTIFYEGYNSLTQAISDLTASNSPSKNIARTFAFFYGVFSVIFSVCFYIYFRGKINNIFIIATLVFCSMNVISFIGYTLFPLSESGYSGTLQDRMHIVVTGFVVILTIISLILFCISFMQITLYRKMGIISICILFLLFVGAFLIKILPLQYFGFAQRINAYSVVIYTGILSFWMYKYIN